MSILRDSRCLGIKVTHNLSRDFPALPYPTAIATCWPPDAHSACCGTPIGQRGGKIMEHETKLSNHEKRIALLETGK